MEVEQSKQSDVLKNYYKYLKQVILSRLSDQEFILVKRNKMLKEGDFLLMYRGKSETEQEKLNEAFTGLSEFNVALKEKKKNKEWYLKIERKYSFLAVLKQVLREEKLSKEENCLACVSLNCSLSDPCALDSLRSLLITEHVSRLLVECGYNINLNFSSDDLQQLKEKFAIEIEKSKPDKSKTHLNEDVWTLLLNSKYLLEKDDMKVSINLKNFAENSTGSLVEGYDKNIPSITVEKDDSRFHTLCNIHISRQINKACNLCVHIVPPAQEHTQQQMILVYNACHQENHCKQFLQVFGSVTARNSVSQTTVPNIEDFYKIRESQMFDAAILKYGDQVKGDGWKGAIEALTIAGIKFEMLSTSCRNQLKLDLSCDDHVDSKGGVFVLYNYARLATLQRNFEEAVQKGIYPALPSLELLDFSVLKEEEEWALLFNYIMVYPSIIQECVADLASGKTRGVFQTHKVCHFLSDLSHDLSSYYRRVRILVEPRPHLYQILHCRLYLMLAVQKIMEKALNLLGIQPLPQL